MTKFKIGEKVIVTKDSYERSNFNEVGAVGTVTNLSDRYFPIVDFGCHGERLINHKRIKPYTEPATGKMVIGKRYRQNSTGNEVVCVGHDQGKCVVRFIDGRNRAGQGSYQSRCGKVGHHLSQWTEIGKITTIRRKVSLYDIYDRDHDSLRIQLDDGTTNEGVVCLTFEDGKLINVEMINN